MGTAALTAFVSSRNDAPIRAKVPQRATLANRRQTPKHNVCCCQRLRSQEAGVVVEANLCDTDLCDEHEHGKSNPHEWVLSSVILRPDDINSWLLDVQFFDNTIGSMMKGEESMKGSYCCVM